MKKVFLFISCATFLLISCDKTFTCECITTYDDASTPADTTQFEVKGNKAIAKIACNDKVAAKVNEKVSCNLK